MSKTAVVYWSGSGNTEAMANAVVDGDHSIGLTDKGLSIAEDTIERNRTIRDLLVSLGVEVAVAEADACEMEHVVSPQSLGALRALAAGKCRDGD